MFFFSTHCLFDSNFICHRSLIYTTASKVLLSLSFDILLNDISESTLRKALRCIEMHMFVSHSCHAKV